MAYRCSACDLDYPESPPHARCSVCEEETWMTNDSTPPDWATRVEARRSAIRSATAFPIPAPDVDVEIVEHGEQKWVAHKLLLDAGYGCLEDGRIVQIQGKYYELNAHIGKSSATVPGGAWWIEEITPDDFKVESPEQIINQ